MDFQSQKRLAYVQATYNRIDGVDQKEIENAESVARKEMSELFV